MPSLAEQLRVEEPGLYAAVRADQATRTTMGGLNPSQAAEQNITQAHLTRIWEASMRVPSRLWVNALPIDIVHNMHGEDMSMM